MSYERPFFVPTKYKPDVFYYIFGVNAAVLQVSASRHHVEKIPQGIESVIVDRTKNAAYMDSLFNSPIGKLLGERNPELFERIRQANSWAILAGEIEEDADLNYIRTCVGLVQAFLDTGAIAVLDLHALALYSAEEFTNRFFEKDFNGFDHVSILFSEENGEIWLHTRGMRKFGRPDVSIEHVDPKEVPWAVGVAEQMIYYSIEGDFFPNKRLKLHISQEETFGVVPELVDDLDNFDFNNAYYKLLWENCVRFLP